MDNVVARMVYGLLEISGAEQETRGATSFIDIPRLFFEERK